MLSLEERDKLNDMVLNHNKGYFQGYKGILIYSKQYLLEQLEKCKVLSRKHSNGDIPKIEEKITATHKHMKENDYVLLPNEIYDNIDLRSNPFDPRYVIGEEELYSIMNKMPLTVLDDLHSEEGRALHEFIRKKRKIRFEPLNEEEKLLLSETIYYNNWNFHQGGYEVFLIYSKEDLLEDFNEALRIDEKYSNGSKYEKRGVAKIKHTIDKIREWTPDGKYIILHREDWFNHNIRNISFNSRCVIDEEDLYCIITPATKVNIYNWLEQEGVEV